MEARNDLSRPMSVALGRWDINAQNHRMPSCCVGFRLHAVDRATPTSPDGDPGTSGSASGCG